MADETADERQARRGRRITGHVFARGRRGVYYVRFACNNREHCIRLLDPATQEPVTEARQARRLADSIIAPYAARDLLALRQSAAEAVRTAQDTVAEAERQAAAARVRKTPLADMLARYPAKHTLPRRIGARVRPLSASTLRQHRESWQQFTEYMAGAHPSVLFAEDVTAEHAAGFADDVLNVQHHARATLNIRLDKLSLAYRRAKLPDPFATVPRYATTDENETREPLSVDELRTVLSTAAGELRRLLALAVYTGLRLGDICQLTWPDHIRLADNRIIKRTRKAGRVVAFPLHSELRAILSETPPAERRGWVLPDMQARYARGVSQVSRLVTRHFEDCGLQTVKPAKEAAAPRSIAVSVRCAHALRHSFITMAAKDGVPAGAIADWIGHSEMVDKVYQHWQHRDTDARILAALPLLTGNGTKALPAAGQAQRDALRRLADTGTIEAVEAALAAGAAVKEGGARCE